MKKLSGYLGTIVILLLVVASVTVPSKTKLENNLAIVNASGDTTKVLIHEESFKVLGFLKVATSCQAQYLGKPVLTNKDKLGYKVHYDTATKKYISVPPDPSVKPIYAASINKVENYIGLFGTFWKYD